MFAIFKANHNISLRKLSLFLFSSAIPYSIWNHLTVTWDQGRKRAKIFINGTLGRLKDADAGKVSYELMNNSHSFYQLGKKEDSGETFHGLIRKLRVFKRVLNTGEIKTEMRGILSAKYFTRNARLEIVGLLLSL